MNVHGIIQRKNHIPPLMYCEDFNSEGYFEYKQRVFEQLAEEHDDNTNDFIKKRDKAICHPSNGILSPTTFSNSSEDKVTKNFLEIQTLWDDSDLSETYSFSSPNLTHYDQISNSSRLVRSDSNAALKEESVHIPKGLMDWSSINDCINSMTDDFKNTKRINSGNNFTHLTSASSWKENENPYQEQKLEREVIRKKLENLDEQQDDLYSNDKPWPKLDHTIPSSRESLHLCYFNASCSSSESEDDYCDVDPKSPFSPISSPSFTASRLFAKRYTRSRPDFSSQNSLSVKPENVMQAKNKKEGLVDFEIGIRSQLAQAHQKAKLEAKATRKKEKSDRRFSLAQKMLIDILPATIISKIKSNSLKEFDCSEMSVGQLQLILNDMHSRKQVLNEELISLLMVRSDLQIKQDVILTDIDDMKLLLSSAGPETTV